MTHKENIVLTDIYRRLNYFHKGDLNTKLLANLYPSEAKPLIKKGLIMHHDGREILRIANWYSLTEKGKELFKKYVTKDKLSEDENLSIFQGKKVINF